MGGFALALFSEASQPWDHFVVEIEFFPHSHYSERIVKGFWTKATERLLSPTSYLIISERFPTQVLSNL